MMWSFIGPAALGLAIGLAAANMGTIAHERGRATAALDALFTERMEHLNTTAALGTCQGRLTLSIQGSEIDNAIPLDLGDLPLSDAFRLFREGGRDGPAPAD